MTGAVGPSGPEASPPQRVPSPEPAPEARAAPAVAPRSGLRNPTAAVRGVGAAALGTEALVMLLGVAPLAKLGGAGSAAAIGLLLGLAVAALALAGMLRRGWAWWAGSGVPVALLAGGWLHWSLGLLGVLFGLLWAYILHVRRSVLGRGISPGSPTG